MNKNTNFSAPERKEKEYKEYERFIALALIPLAVYLFWPFLFGQENIDQAQVVEERIEKIDDRVEEELDATMGDTKANDTSSKVNDTRNRKTTPLPAKPQSKKSNQIRNTPPVRKPVPPKNNNTFTLTYNKGDKIEYITQPQNTGWRGIVQNKNRGSYTVKITEVLLANDKQLYLATNDPCNGGKRIGKKTINQTIVVPGRCIHQK